MKNLAYKLFDHNIKFLQFIGNLHGYETTNSMITKYPTPAYNFVYLNTKDDKLITDLQAQGIPFLCHPSIEMKDELVWLLSHGLTKTDDQIIQVFENLQAWEYEVTDANIQMHRVTTPRELMIFDHISSIAFQEPEGLAFKFLNPILCDPNFSIFLAKINHEPIGCLMIAIIDNVPGLYWGGIIPEFRKQGIGTACLRAGLNFIKNNGYDSAITISLPSAINLCQRIGFKAIGPISCYVSP